MVSSWRTTSLERLAAHQVVAVVGGFTGVADEEGLLDRHLVPRHFNLVPQHPTSRNRMRHGARTARHAPTGCIFWFVCGTHKQSTEAARGTRRPGGCGAPGQTQCRARRQPARCTVGLGRPDARQSLPPRLKPPSFRRVPEQLLRRRVVRALRHTGCTHSPRRGCRSSCA